MRVHFGHNFIQCVRLCATFIAGLAHCLGASFVLLLCCTTSTASSLTHLTFTVNCLVYLLLTFVHLFAVPYV